MRTDRRVGAAALLLPILCLALAGLSARPAAAGVVYVPVPPPEGGRTVEVLAFNRDPGVARRYTARLLAAGTDGTAGREEGGDSTVQVARQATGVLVLGADTASGLLEISSAPQLSFEARLRLPGGDAPSLPVIGSENVITAGDFAELVGLERAVSAAGTKTANVGVANLGHSVALCTARLSRAGGAEAGERVSFEMAPLSYGHFEDALAVFGVDSAAGTTLWLACDQPYYAYAVQRTAAGGAERVVLPAASGRSTLVLPGEPGGPGTYPPGSIVFTRSGDLHTPTPQKPTAIFEIDVPPGKSFSRVEIEFEYTHAGWSHTPDGNHSLFWLHRGRWLQSRWADNIYAFVNAFGGRKGLVKVLTNVDAGKARQVWSASYELQAGRTYGVRYVYDTVSEDLHLTLVDRTTGQTVVDLFGDTYGKPIVADDQGAFFVYFGHQDDTGIAPERPSYGSTWSDLEAVFVP